MKQAHPASSVRLVPKAPSLPVAQEPPVPIVTSSKPSKAKSAAKTAKQEKKQRRQELLVQAEDLSQQNPGFNQQNAYEILLGKYTLEEWTERRQATIARQKALALQRRLARFGDKRSDEEKAWCSRFFDGPDPEPIWMETAGGDLIARVTRVKIFTVAVQVADGSYRGLEKTEISALCGAGLSPQVQGMRQVEPESKRDVLPARKPKERWAFPEASFAGWVGGQIRIQLLNGSIWTGFLRWNSRFSFLLGAQPEGEPEVLLFKHACCGVQLLHQSY